MKPTPHASRRRAFLLFPFLIMPLFVAPPRATNATQQTSPAAAAAQVAPDTSGTLKLTVTVIDEKGRYVAGLTKDAFAVFEGKAAREITYFNADDVPSSVGILIDVSRSMQSGDVDAARQMTDRFIRFSRPENEYFVAEFSDKWRELTAWTRDRQAIASGLRKVGAVRAEEKQRKSKSRGDTALYDACFGALEKMERAAHRKRVLLLLTGGGQDDASTHKQDKLRRLIATSGILLYSVAPAALDGEFVDYTGQKQLQEMAGATGGHAYFTDNGALMDEVIERIAMELRYQYIVGFTPANAAQSGKWNKVKIKVTPPQKFIKNVLVRSSEGYFSPSPAP